MLNTKNLSNKQPLFRTLGCTFSKTIRKGQERGHFQFRNVANGLFKFLVPAWFKKDKNAPPYGVMIVSELFVA